MTDDDVLTHAPTACALVCAVHDQDADATHEILDGVPADTAALLVLLARMVPDRKTLRELLAPEPAGPDVQRNSDGIPLFAEDWTDAELRKAHAAWNRRVHTRWSEEGEREYQRRRQARRRARKNGTEGLACPECGQMPPTTKETAA